MIEDSKWVKSVTSNTPRKGYKIIWHDDKPDNIFNDAWVKMAEQALSEGKMLHYEKEKNEKGYWNITSLEFAGDALSEDHRPPPMYPKDEKAEPVAPHISGQEVGMWWKELGECLRCGEVDKDTPVGKSLRKAYYAQMFSVLGISIEKDATE